MNLYFKNALGLLKRVGFFSFFFASSLISGENAPSYRVLVTVPPHKFFVEQIAGDTVNAELLVPQNASSHTFEPSPKQMIQAGKADLWFGIGEPFETKMISVLKNHDAKVEFIDLRKGVNLIGDSSLHAHNCGSCCKDLHIWLSPRRAKIQAQTIAEALKNTYPEHSEIYEKQLDAFLKKLDSLDSYIQTLFKSLKNCTVFVSHPAYNYFADDYRLVQISIEFEGKDPTPWQLTNILKKAKEANIKTIFIQPQYSNKGAKLIAKEIGANIATLDPYSENYFESMKAIAEQMAESCKD